MPPSKTQVSLFADGSIASGDSRALAYCQQRPAHEKWAVLVEGSPVVLEQPDGVVLRQLVSGCVCCVGQLVFRTSVAQILRLEKPHRLLIEIANPDHRVSLIEVLRSPTFVQHLEIVELDLN